MSVADLASELGVGASDVVKKLIGMGLMISSNQAILHTLPQLQHVLHYPVDSIFHMNPV